MRKQHDSRPYILNQIHAGIIEIIPTNQGRSMIGSVKALTICEVFEFFLRVVRFLLHGNHNVFPFIIQPFDMHRAHKVDERIGLAQEHVDCRTTRITNVMLCIIRIATIWFVAATVNISFACEFLWSSHDF